MAIDFPSAPSTGQTYAYSGHTYSYDGEKWTEVSGLGPGVNVQVFTADGTYTPTPGMRYCKVIATGGGGGGGGSDTDGTGAGGGSGGAAGSTCIRVYTAAELGATATIDIGAAGTGGTAAGGNGTNGASTTFTPAGSGTALTAAGTSGVSAGTGTAATDATRTAAGQTGTPTGGQINIAGGRPGDGVSGPADGVSNPPFAIGGAGGASYWGGGGRTVTRVTGGDTVGDVGQAYGSGGGGACSVDSATGAVGGDGVAGVVYIEEFVGADYSSAAYIDPLTALTSVESSTDYLLIYDASTSLNKKVLVDDLAETGTWTPTFSATGATYSYAGQAGYYSKVGDVVTCHFRIQLNTSGNTLGSAGLNLAGLPFTSLNQTSFRSTGTLFWTNSTSSLLNAAVVLNDNLATAGFFHTTAAVTTMTAANSNTLLHATTGTVIIGSIVYKAD